MTDTDLTHLYFLLDRSGSMQSIVGDTVGGFDAFVEQQRTREGECRVSLAQFDDGYEVVYTDLPIADVPSLVLEPRGTTALLDALGRMVVQAGDRLAAMPEDRRPDSIVVGVMTDGYENASREWTHPRIKALVQQQTDTYGWQFFYLGADQDAVEEGMRMGFEAGKSMTYDRGRAAPAMAAMSDLVGGFRDAKRAGMSDEEARLLTVFTDVQRGASRD